MKPYKELRKFLRNEFINPYTREYSCNGAIVSWVMQCGIKCTDKHVNIICHINNGMVYPYQKADRKTVLKYLKRTKKCLDLK